MVSLCNCTVLGKCGKHHSFLHHCNALMLQLPWISLEFSVSRVGDESLSRDGGGENPGDGAAAERGLSQNDSDTGAFKY